MPPRSGARPTVLRIVVWVVVGAVAIGLIAAGVVGLVARGG